MLDKLGGIFVSHGSAVVWSSDSGRSSCGGSLAPGLCCSTCWAGLQQ